MREPVYLRPSSMDEALELLDTWGNKARILAGGTDLLVAMRRDVVEPDAVVDITRLKEIRGISHQKGHIRIGSLTTHQEIYQDASLQKDAPQLVSACRMVGSLQIRNRGTLGGNIGNASPAGDTIPPLFTLEAEVGLLSVNGERWVKVEEFFTGPGTTMRKPNEVIIGVRFIPLNQNNKSFFNKIGQRRAVTISKVSAAGLLLMEGNVVRECRLALGAVAPTVIRLRDAEKVLSGKSLSMESINETAELCGFLCSPINDIRSTIEYRCAMSRVLVGRGLKSIMEEVNNE